MPETEVHPAIRLTIQRFATEGGVRPGLDDIVAAGSVRLFEVEGDALPWLAWSQTQASPGSVAMPPAPPRGAAQVDAMVFDLCRDVGNPDHRPGDVRWLYVVHTDVPDDVAAEYNNWYDTEHLPRLARVPGVVRARRYVACEGHPRYFTAYDLAERDAFNSPQGLQARKTPWTERMRSLFSNTRRYTGRLLDSPAS